MWRGYKTSAGVPPDLLAQFPLLEDALGALGVVVWPMIEFEADDALAAAAVKSAADEDVDRVFICTPDKDLAQCVRGTRVVQLLRRTNVVLDEAAVLKKFGVESRIDPGLSRAGRRLLGRLPRTARVGSEVDRRSPRQISSISKTFRQDSREWRVNANNAAALARTFAEERDLAFLFRDLATLRTEIPVFDSVDDLRWKGPTERFADLAARFDRANDERQEGEQEIRRSV